MLSKYVLAAALGAALLGVGCIGPGSAEFSFDEITISNPLQPNVDD